MIRRIALLLFVFAGSSVAQNVLLTINETGVSCVVRPNRNSIITCKEDVEATERQFSPLDPVNYIEECGNECARRRRDGELECVGFLYRNNQFAKANKRLSCTFFSCRNIQSSDQDGVIAVAMREECFYTWAPTTSPSASPTESPSMAPSTMSPTDSPTITTSSPTPRPTKRPTLRPTKVPTTLTPTISTSPTESPTFAPSSSPTLPTSSPTQSPSKSPTPPTSSPTERVPTEFPTASPTKTTDSPTLRRTVSPTAPGGFQSPSGIGPGEKLDWSRFNKVQTNPNLCMIARPQMNTPSVTYENFGGTLVDCLKECQFDDICTGIIYSEHYDVCKKVLTMETTDDSSKVDDYTQYWVAYTKDNAPVAYYANYCGLFNLFNLCTPANTMNQCKWGAGPRGYNQNRHTDELYCGRVACNRNLG